MFKPNVPPPSLPTVGIIAAELGEPLHRVAYAIRSRSIQPTARAGRLRLYDAETVDRIRTALTEIKKGGV